MIDTSKVQFPLTLAAFAILQRNEMRRIPTIEEMEIFSQIVDTANVAYHAAAAGDADTALGILNDILIAGAQTPGAAPVAAMCRGWVLLAIGAGKDVFKREIDSMEE